MDALLAAAAAVAGDDRPIRVVLVPTAVARHRPELAAAHGTRAFEAAAARAGRAVEVRVAMVVDAASATDDAMATVLEAADLIHLPGGDPDVIPSVLPGSRPGRRACGRTPRARASPARAPGAMALAARLWTPRGPMDGLGLVPGIAVLPHFQRDRLGAWRSIVDPDGTLRGSASRSRRSSSAAPAGAGGSPGRAAPTSSRPGRTARRASAGPGERIDLPVG